MKVKRLIGAWTKNNKSAILTDILLFYSFVYERTKSPFKKKQDWDERTCHRYRTSREFEKVHNLHIKNDMSVISLRRIFETTDGRDKP